MQHRANKKLRNWRTSEHSCDILKQLMNPKKKLSDHEQRMEGENFQGKP
jgi:hypothetical protein